MSRFPSPAHAERIDDRIQKLDDGFERLGEQDTPFTLRKGGKSLERAKALHSDRDVEFRDKTIRGKYWRGVQLIEIGTDEEDFPGFREGIVLAHELGHAFYDAWSPDSGIEEASRLFTSETEQAQARAISERLHGPFIETDGPFADYRAGSDEELAAAVFASRIIEPMAAQRIAPDAVRRLEEVFGELSDRLF